MTNKLWTFAELGPDVTLGDFENFLKRQSLEQIVAQGIGGFTALAVHSGGAETTREIIIGTLDDAPVAVARLGLVVALKESGIVHATQTLQPIELGLRRGGRGEESKIIEIFRLPLRPFAGLGKGTSG